MSKVIDLEQYKLENSPHFVAELICLGCCERWIGVWQEKVLLKELECKCGEKGKIIRTGQDLEHSSS